MLVVGSEYFYNFLIKCMRSWLTISKGNIPVHCSHICTDYLVILEAIIFFRVFQEAGIQFLFLTIVYYKIRR